MHGSTKVILHSRQQMTNREAIVVPIYRPVYTSIYIYIYEMTHIKWSLPSYPKNAMGIFSLIDHYLYQLVMGPPKYYFSLCSDRVLVLLLLLSLFSDCSMYSMSYACMHA